MALEAISRKLTRVMTMAGSTSGPRVAHSKASGQYSAGSPAGRLPTTGPPLAANPIPALSTAVSATTTTGKFGNQRLPNTSAARLAKPKAAPVGLIFGWSTRLASEPLKPSSMGNCDNRIKIAAACVKPVNMGELTRFSSQPKRPSPSSNCNAPDSNASYTASSTHCPLPGAARPVSDALMSRHVSAVGPTGSRVEAPHSTATSGMPASAA